MGAGTQVRDSADRAAAVDLTHPGEIGRAHRSAVVKPR
jgi:hypothetical protein